MAIALVSSFLTVHAEPATPTEVESEITEELIPCEATVEDDFVTGEIMVGIKAAYSEVNKVWTAADFPEISGITEIEDLTYADTEAAIEKFSAKENFHQLLKIVISNTTKSAVIAGVDALEQNDKLLFAEPNSIIEMEEPVVSQDNGIALANNLSLNNSQRYKKYTNDPYLLQQDGIYLHNVDKVWNAFTKGSSNVVVGVIDDGIYAHPDMSANLIPGYIGYTQTNDSTYTYTGNHGTGVAAVIGAKGNNGRGISGVCQQVSLRSLRVTNDDGDYTSEGYAGAYLKASVDNIPIVNCSYGCEDTNLIKNAMSLYSGLIVLASGNDGKEVNASNQCLPVYWNMDNMIITGGVNVDGSRDTGKNYSSTIVDLMALSNTVYTCDSELESTSYSYWSGTSVAAPFVAGVAALLLSYDSTLTTAQLKQYILEGVQTVPALANYCSTGGYLDAYGAFLAMLEDKPLCLNLVAKTNPDATDYSFSVYHNNTYARLSEIVIPGEIQDYLEGVSITQTSDTITVIMSLEQAWGIEATLIEFHFISYSSLTYAKAYTGLSTTYMVNSNGIAINGNIPSSKILMGDATGDGVVDIMDQLKITQHVGNPFILSGDNERAADVNGDYLVTEEDATQVGNYCVSSILSFH